MGTNLSSISQQDGSQVKWDGKSFSQGVSRKAFKGTFVKGPNTGDCCVVKTFINKRNQNLKNWEIDLTTLKTAKYFAELFNQYSNNQELPFIPIVFLRPYLLKVHSTTLWSFFFNKNFSSGDLILAEPFLYGHYRKFNSNSGYSDPSYKVPSAFSHFTLVKSGYKGCVCDIQGVLDDKQKVYFLTDPSIHSIDKRFGSTDLGIKGIKDFLGKHKCNDVCRALGLEQPSGFQPIFPTLKCTSYTLI